MPAPRIALTVALLLTPLVPAPAQDSAEDAFSKIPWQPGPMLGELGTEARVATPDDCTFTGADGTRQRVSSWCSR